MNIAAVLLAAGSGTRMRGADKLLETVRGQPVLLDRVLMLAETDLSGIIVVVSGDHPERQKILNGYACNVVVNVNSKSGMASSVQTGLAALGADVDAALILPADMPDITTEDINAVCKLLLQNPQKIVRATDQSGQPGNPVLIPRRFFGEFENLTGDVGGRSILAKYYDKVIHAPLPGNHATLDLDTPEAWASWRADQIGKA